MGQGFFRDLWRITCLSELGRHEESAGTARALLEKYPDRALSYALAVDAIVDRPDVDTAELEDAEAYADRLIEIEPRSLLGYTR